MSKYIVTATNGEQTRNETIDIKENVLFHGCKSVDDIKKNYEGFWNIPSAKEKITVLKVTKLFQLLKGGK
jgi:hypothetical protein